MTQMWYVRESKEVQKPDSTNLIEVIAHYLLLSTHLCFLRVKLLLYNNTLLLAFVASMHLLLVWLTVL